MRKESLRLRIQQKPKKLQKKEKIKKKKKKQKRYPKILGTTINRQKDNSQSQRKYLEPKQPTKD